MTEEEIIKLAKAIRRRILDDILDRRGWRQEWDGFDADVQDAIRATHLELIANEIRRLVNP